MILPGTYTLSLALLVLSLLAWGTWANTFKLTGGKWRFELFYFDFAVGVMLAAIVAGFTFGSMGWDGFSLLDDLQLAGKREDLFAFLGGAVFNLGNMLLVATISIAGMSVAFPAGLGVALIVSVLWSFLLNHPGNPLVLAAGCILIFGAVILDAIAYRSQFMMKLAAAPALAGKNPTTGKVIKAAPKRFRSKGVVLAVLSGLLIGSCYPLLDIAKKTQSNNGLGPYSVGFVFALGILFTTFGYNLFFMNLPIQGKPVEIGEYFRGRARAHWLGVLGGVIWYVGTVSSLVAARAEGAAQPGPALGTAMGQGAIVLSALCGLILWKEFAGADGRIKTFVAVMLFLFVAGVTLISVSPIFAHA